MKRLAYVGHHGTTDLYLTIHAELEKLGLTGPDPAVLSFNRYWSRRVRTRYPKALVETLPSGKDWETVRKRPNQLPDSERFRRAWKIDKILRRQPVEKVLPLWGEIVRRASRFLDEAKPSFILSECIQSLPCYAIYTECRDRGIPYIQMTTSRLQGRLQFHLGESSFPDGLENPETPSPEALAFAREYVRRVRDPHYAGPYAHSSALKRRKPLLKVAHFKKAWRYLMEQLDGGYGEPTAPAFLHPFTSKWKSIHVGRSHQKGIGFVGIEAVRALPGKKLFLPLQVTPEVSTDLWAPRYNDMAETARKIVLNMPEGWTLVMKEAPGATYNQRRPKDLETLRSLPRSLFVSPLAPNDELLKLTDLLIVVNSTLGLEAFIKGWPVVTLGQPFYDASGNTVPCADLKELPETIQRALSFRPDPDRTVHFLACYYQSTHPGMAGNPFLSDTVLNPDNVQRIVQALSQRFIQKR